MVLLTSGQVSVAISSFIVFLFTSALFLSGYVLQQKTVNDIREAIKPQIAPLKPELYLPPKFRPDEFWDGKETTVVVESTATDQQTTKDFKKQEVDGDGKRNDEDMVGATRWQKAAKQKEKERLKNEAAAQKLIGESEDKSASVKGSKKDKSRKEVEEQPLSPAERRKKIKEEILAAGEGESFKGYRRRMW